jgi:hypothetical protein
MNRIQPNGSPKFETRANVGSRPLMHTEHKEEVGVELEGNILANVPQQIQADWNPK